MREEERGDTDANFCVYTSITGRDCASLQSFIAEANAFRAISTFCSAERQGRREVVSRATGREGRTWVVVGERGEDGSQNRWGQYREVWLRESTCTRDSRESRMIAHAHAEQQ